jgi:hypothetical protein
LWGETTTERQKALECSDIVCSLGAISSRRASGVLTVLDTGLIKVDLTSSWDWRTNISIQAVPKRPNPRTGADPPVVVRGALYAGAPSGSRIHEYGGTVSYMNMSFPGFQNPTSSQYALWSYNTGNDSWNQFDVTLGAEYRPAGGAYAEAQDQELAFYLNGYINNGTLNDLENWNDFLRYLNGLIVIDTQTQMATNISTSSLANFPRARGGMAYIPGIGPRGILVAVGGVTKPADDDSASNEGIYVCSDVLCGLWFDTNQFCHRCPSTRSISSTFRPFLRATITASGIHKKRQGIYRTDGRTFAWSLCLRGIIPVTIYTCTEARAQAGYTTRPTCSLFRPSPGRKSPRERRHATGTRVTW